ncbi:MAG: hypothetical protein R6U88_02395 [Candidatus Bipolaricaulota bacterium]
MNKGTAANPSKTLVELAKYLLKSIVRDPERARVDHVWTESMDLIVLQSTGKRRLHPRDVDAVARVVQAVGERLGREVMVDHR